LYCPEVPCNITFYTLSLFQVAFTHAEKVGLQDTKPVSNGTAAANAATEEDDDEINLDDI